MSKEINVNTIAKDAKAGKFPLLEATVIEHTKSAETGAELITFEIFAPRIILPEINTHRNESKNTGSSRAIPTKKLLSTVAKRPFVPFYWGENIGGMVSKTQMGIVKRVMAATIWGFHRWSSIFTAWGLNKLGVHKQWANRPLETHLYVRQVISSTDLSNFYGLRIDDNAQPEIVALALLMKHKQKMSKPRMATSDPRHVGSWHLPYITQLERVSFFDNPWHLVKLSAARCARTSYLTQEGMVPKPEKELGTFEKLVASRPIHASPLEHPAHALKKADERSRNYRGFKQYREIFEEASC